VRHLRVVGVESGGRRDGHCGGGSRRGRRCNAVGSDAFGRSGVCCRLVKGDLGEVLGDGGDGRDDGLGLEGRGGHDELEALKVLAFFDRDDNLLEVDGSNVFLAATDPALGGEVASEFGAGLGRERVV